MGGWLAKRWMGLVTLSLSLELSRELARVGGFSLKASSSSARSALLPAGRFYIFPLGLGLVHHSGRESQRTRYAKAAGAMPVG